MKKRKDKIIVMSLGGSVVIPDEVDHVFLDKLKRILNKFKHKFVIVVGGGKTARKYIQALRKEGLSDEKQDSIGIECTMLNARLVSLIFKLDQKIPKTIQESLKIAKRNRISIGGGMKPKTTTDGIASLISSKLKADMLINITNVDGLYTRDPKKYKNAKLIRKISFSNFLKIVNKIKEKPGQHFILDRLAAQTISKYKIKTIIIGKDMYNFENLLRSKKFKGTIIG